MARFNSDYPVKNNPTPSDRVWGLNLSGVNNRGFTIGSIIDLAGLNEPQPRVLSVDLVITSDIAGTLTALWVSNTFITRSVTDQALVFIGAPAVDNFRFDNILGNDDGTITVQAGTPATSNPTIPTAPAGSIVLKTILWNELGESQVEGGSSAFPEIRYTTRLEPGTNGKYAKIWEGNLSREQNFQLHISYGAVSSSQDWSVSSPGKSGLMVLNWLCDNNRNILANNVQFFTVDSNSEAGDFVLVQRPGFKAAIFHKSTDFWMRMQFRIVFQNSAFRIQDFVNNGAYAALPAGTNWESAKYAGGVSWGAITGTLSDQTDLQTALNAYKPSILEDSNTVPFDKDYIMGLTPRTGNILFDFTNAELGATSVMPHQDLGAFTIPIQAKQISGTYDGTVLNYLDFQLIDKTIGSEVVRLTISQVQP